MNRRTWLGIGAVLVGSASGCGFSSGGGDNAVDAAVVDAAPPDATPDPQDFRWSIDNDEQFKTDTTITGGFVANDRLEPQAWADGYLLTFGNDDLLFNVDADEAAISSAISAAFADSNFNSPILSNPTNVQYGNTAPLGLGFTATDEWTVWSVGEIYLEQGANKFEMKCDSRCAFGISQDAGLTYETMVASGTKVTLTITITGATGYYPVAYAISNSSTGAFSEILHDPPGAPGNAPLSRWRLRYPVTAAPASFAFSNTGLIQTGFENRNTVSPIGDVLRTLPTINEDYGTGVPEYLGIAGIENWSQRLAGQLWIEVAGVYKFSYASDDGFRISIDDNVFADTIPATRSTGDIELVRGWHDLRIEQEDKTGFAKLIFKVEVVPATETELVVGEPIPASRLRPIITGRERLAATRLVVEGTDQVNGEHDITLDLPSGATATQFFLGYDLQISDASKWDQLNNEFDVRGSAANYSLPDPANGSPVRQDISAAIMPTEIPDATGGKWTLNLDPGNGPGSPTFTLREVGVSARFTGGPASIGSSTSFLSPVKDAGRVVQLSALKVDAGAPDGSTVTVEFRVCTANPCTSEPWMPAADVATSLPSGQFFQIRAALTSNGIAVPFLDSLKLEGRDAE